MNISGYINKIMIDSRFKAPYSVSNVNFSIELNENIQLPDRTGCIVTDVTIPRTWYAINSTNNKIYFRVKGADDTTSDYVAVLQPQNYTIESIATNITEAMNQQIGELIFTCLGDPYTGKLKIMIADNLAQSFWIFTDADLQSRCNRTWTGPYFNRTNTLSINSVVRNDSAPSMQEYTTNNPFYSGVIDLVGIHSIYITSTALTTYNNIGSRGERNILKKVLCNQSFGDLIIDHTYLDKDYTDVSNRFLKVLDFRVVDVYGNDLDLNGGHVSFSLLFCNI